MAGFVVHLAVAEEYIRKHGNIKNHNEFLLGAINQICMRIKRYHIMVLKQVNQI